MEELEELMKRWEGIIKNELKKKFGGEWYVSIIHDVEVRPDVDGIEVFTIFASPNDHSGRVYELFYPVKIYEIYEPDDKDRSNVVRSIGKETYDDLLIISFNAVIKDVLKDLIKEIEDRMNRAFPSPSER